MIEKLKEVESILHDLVRQPELWNTLDVDYYPPRVERQFRKEIVKSLIK